MIRLCLFVSILVRNCWALEELCKKSSEFEVKDSDIVDNVVVWLHTTPVEDSHYSSKWNVEFEHELSLVFYFPDTKRTMTYKGLAKEGEGYSCFENVVPKERDGSTWITLGVTSGSPKMFVNLAKENDKSQSYQSEKTLLFSQNWVMNMAKRIGGDIWEEMKDPRQIFDEQKEETFEEQKEETFEEQKEETFDQDDLKCAASLGVDLLLLYSYNPFQLKSQLYAYYATYVAKTAYYGYKQYHESTTFHLCLKTFMKMKSRYYD